MNLVPNRVSLIGCAMLLASAATNAQEAAEEWTHTVFIYGMGASLEGESQIGPLEIPVDLSMSDVLDNLKMGGMAAYRAANGTWSFSTDMTYMQLGATERFSDSRKGDVDIKQSTLMMTAGRRVTDRLEALFGVAYFNLKTQLVLTGPVIGRQAASVNVDWVDPTIGLKWSQPIGERWQVNLRGDVGGFGMGSELLVHGLLAARFQQNEHLGWVFGYRLIDFEYEEDEGRGPRFKRFDLQEKGPLLGVAYTF